jgi:hypothetical protein
VGVVMIVQGVSRRHEVVKMLVGAKKIGTEADAPKVNTYQYESREKMLKSIPRLTAWAIAVLIGLGLFNHPALGAEAKSAPLTEWDRTVEAAKKEAKLNVYFWQGNNLDKVVQLFEKRYPDIKLTTVGSGFELLHPHRQ